MTLIFFQLWYRITFILCVATFGMALLAGGIPAVVAGTSAFWPIVILSGIIAYHNTSATLEGIDKEVTRRLRETQR